MGLAVAVGTGFAVSEGFEVGVVGVKVGATCTGVGALEARVGTTALSVGAGFTAAAGWGAADVSAPVVSNARAVVGVWASDGLSVGRAVAATPVWAVGRVDGS